ncbi:hypothetical protein MTR67_018280 [Solanum verrucosum]|uniref:Uncharacterized protein n=1 Tax=Solanum verrucosum TaxID=315347 RepID=A0AAF0TSX4_SOLVR|nr:hypothetical protein MTR67_018280 [Solanum verrucosum]
MEQWPPLPTKVKTPTSGNNKPADTLGSNNQAEMSEKSPDELQKSEIRGDAQRKLDMNAEPIKKWRFF